MKMSTRWYLNENF